METVNYKTHMYELYNAGVFGNRLRTWPTLKEMRLSGYTGKIGLRYSGPITGPRPFRTNMTEREALDEFGVWCARGVSSAYIVWCEAADPQRVVIQGDVKREPGGLHVLYSRDKGDWRQAMKSASARTSCTGIVAQLLLQHFMDPYSWEDLQVVLDRFDSIIEFSVFDHDLGTIPHRNTVIWECRNY